MDDLTTWLRAQLDVDQSAAEEMKRVFPTPWELADRGWMARIVADGPHFHEVVRLDQKQAPGVGELDGVIRHVLLQDPDRVLREVEAKREIIVAQFEYAMALDAWSGCRHSAADIEAGQCPNYDPATGRGLPLLRIETLPFSDRPGYQESWRP